MEIEIKNLIESVEQQAAVLTYPEYVKKLREAGVISYDVEVSNRNKVFKMDSGQEITVLGQLLEIECSNKFKLEDVIGAVKRKQEGITDYPTFLRELANAGVHTYFADLKKLCVKYKGSRASEEYTEKIEDLKKPNE